MITARSSGDKVFDAFNISILSIFLFIVIYPLYITVISSISDPIYVLTGNVWFYPKGITFSGYARIFADDTIWQGYYNAILYTTVGTTINVVLTVTGGYALSRSDLIGRDMVMIFIAFTLFFSGGLIPNYLLVKELGMVNTMWAIVIPTAISAFNLIIARTFFQSTIPHELLEASQIDGCSDMNFFLRIVLPLSQPIIAVMILFYAVFHWNSYFPALIYLQDESKHPLQLVLRRILISSEVMAQMMMDLDEVAEQQKVAESMKYGMIIVACLPMLILYPFLQKYFVKGIMIGSIKG